MSHGLTKLSASVKLTSSFWVLLRLKFVVKDPFLWPTADTHATGADLRLRMGKQTTLSGHLRPSRNAPHQRQTKGVALGLSDYIRLLCGG